MSQTPRDVGDTLTRDVMTEPRGRQVSVGCVQLQARGVEEADQSLREADVAVRAAVEQGAELVVLPECTWPGYVIGSSWRSWWSQSRQEEVLAAWAGLARELGVVLVGGIALAGPQGLSNTAVVWERDGSVAGRVSKRFLWDFDTKWFSPGNESPVIETSLGRLGVLVCADGRMPEVARILAVSGAELLVDPTAWVTAGPDPTTWTNAQFEFMLPTRARENGLWVVAANKVGFEAGAVAYCGRSCVVDEAGVRVATAPSSGPAVVVAPVNMHPAIFPVSREPGSYGALTQVRVQVPDAAAERAGPAGAHRVVLDAMDTDPDPSVLRRLSDLGADLFITTRTPEPQPDTPTVIRDGDVAVLYDGGVARARWTRGLVSSGDTVVAPVSEHGSALMAVLLDEDALLPELPRIAMLAGAEILVWFASPDLSADVVADTARTRALENRVFVCVCGRAGSDSGSTVYSPDGAQMAASGDVSRFVSAVLPRCEAWRKQMAPGTDVVRGRQPKSYSALVRT